MDMTLRESGGRIILAIVGEININNSGQLRTVLQNLISDGKKILSLNMEHVSFIDSSGIGTMLSIVPQLRDLRGDLTVINPSKTVLRIFQLTKLTTVFQIAEAEDAALRGAFSP